MSPVWMAFGVGALLSGFVWVPTGLALSALLTTAKRADQKAKRMYEDEVRRRVAEAEAEDHRAITGERFDWTEVFPG